jgi:flagellar basal-body rod protein FlgC
MISFLAGVSASAGALNAERTRLEIISQNIANANTTRGLDGKPYARQSVVFESVLRQSAGGSQAMPELHVAGIMKDQRPPQLVFNPGHPDADAQGMVAMPNVNIHEEMADMIVASRAFEANLAVIKNARMLAMQALSIGKK